MLWTWDPAKNRANRRKHGLGRDTASLVFGDPLAASRPDPEEREERWQTVGVVGTVVIVVVHTTPRPDPVNGMEVGRIISARRATRHERRAYEEGDF